jgi:hypothetical protein
MIFRSADPELSIPNVPLSDFVMAQFAAFGDKPAVIDGPTGRTLTYAQLAVDVRRMAVGLVRRGMKKGDVLPTARRATSASSGARRPRRPRANSTS